MKTLLKLKSSRSPSSAKGSRKSGLFIRLLLLLVLILYLWIIYVQWIIQTSKNEELPAKADAAIVLGASVRNDVPSPGLKERLDRTLELYKAGKFKHIIVSGGLDHNGSKFTEAEGMLRYLVQQGVPEKSIVLEPLATSTYENLLYSKRIMDKEGWHTAIIVTHKYHGARSRDIAEFVGLANAALSTMDSQVLYMPWHEAREMLAFSKWEWQKIMLSLGLYGSP